MMNGLVANCEMNWQQLVLSHFKGEKNVQIPTSHSDSDKTKLLKMLPLSATKYLSIIREDNTSTD